MATAYCTATHIAKRISSSGIDLRVDDDTSAIAAVIEEASIEVNGYLQLLYEVADLAQSEWVRLKTTDIAVYYLCLRRLNSAPKAVEKRYEKAIEDLEKAQSGSVMLPDIPMGKSSVPVISNQRVALDPFVRVVTEPNRSTGPQEGYIPHNDRNDYPHYDI